MWCRGIRGATTADSNTREDVLKATGELLLEMIKANGVDPGDISCAMFTTTPDLNAEFPAVAVRQLGWTDVPLLCSREVDVPDSLQSCIRILILHNTEKSSDEIVHIYTRGATELKSNLRNVRSSA